MGPCCSPGCCQGRSHPQLGAFPAVASCLGDVGRESGPASTLPALCSVGVEGGGGVKLQVHSMGDPGWLHSPAWCPEEGSGVLPPQVVSLQRPLREGVSLTWLRTLGEPSPSFRSSERLGCTSLAQVREEGAGPPLGLSPQGTTWTFSLLSPWCLPPGFQVTFLHGSVHSLHPRLLLPVVGVPLWKTSFTPSFLPSHLPSPVPLDFLLLLPTSKSCFLDPTWSLVD